MSGQNEKEDKSNFLRVRRSFRIAICHYHVRLDPRSDGKVRSYHERRFGRQLCEHSFREQITLLARGCDNNKPPPVWP